MTIYLESGDWCWKATHLIVNCQIYNDSICRYRVRAEKRRESWGGSTSSVSGGGLGRGAEQGAGASGGRGAESRALVAATAPLALSRTDSAIQVSMS